MNDNTHMPAFEVGRTLSILEKVGSRKSESSILKVIYPSDCDIPIRFILKVLVQEVTSSWSFLIEHGSDFAYRGYQNHLCLSKSVRHTILNVPPEEFRGEIFAIFRYIYFYPIGMRILMRGVDSLLMR